MNYHKSLNQQPLNHSGKYVLYWAHAAIRIRYNLALQYASECARQQGKRLQIVYQLVPNYPQANQRHFHFLLGGLQEFAVKAQLLGCDVAIICETTNEQLLEYCQQASIVISDTSYLRYFQIKQKLVAQQTNCQFERIETNIIVPVEQASPKQEYTAGTFRPKITGQLETYLHPLPEVQAVTNQPGKLTGSQWLEPAVFCEKWQIPATAAPIVIASGEQAAQAQLQLFLQTGLIKYGQLATTFDDEASSQLSAFLHFGHISPLDIALQVQNTLVPQSQIDNFLEQIIVRRELAINYVYYCEHYDRFPEALPEWAKTTLAEHQNDLRTYDYTYEQLAAAQTHDPIWNQAQQQMVETGRMNNYLRMYWGKKVIEWTKTHAQAWEYLIRLNDTYELDGRDPNGYVGIAWCFGLHDRAWSERPIFGKTRYMNETGVIKRQRAAKKGL